jgi:hypothetical protein
MPCSAGKTKQNRLSELSFFREILMAGASGSESERQPLLLQYQRRVKSFSLKSGNGSVFVQAFRANTPRLSKRFISYLELIRK